MQPANVSAKIQLDQANLTLNRSQVENGYSRPNNAKREIKKTIDLLKNAYTILDGNNPTYRSKNG